jgi:subtilase family serine protease
MKKALLACALILATVATSALPAAAAPGRLHAVCGPTAPGFARCFAEVRTGGPAGLAPADLRAAYHLPATGGANQTVAIVDAGDDAGAEADLAVYRSTFGLPACTSDNGCFRKVNQRGGTDSWPEDVGWGEEISLDLDMVSAACPACHILLVEGDSTSFDDLGASVNTAVALGATEVSNSYGGTETNGITDYEADYAHPGVAIVTSSGDFGFGIANAPASFPSVIAVGGTTLTKADNARGWTETAWSEAASGCSAWVAKPAWQQDPNCPGRMIADVSADADPDTGPAIYDAYDGIGWDVGGGTSAASPYIAAVIGLAGNPAQLPNASYVYAHASALNDVTGGNNSYSQDCGGDYECNALPGYDGPTGLGTPAGITAF